jgi:hypothetical protein
MRERWEEEESLGEGDVVVVVVQRGLEWGAGVGKKRERERGQRR